MAETNILQRTRSYNTRTRDLRSNDTRCKVENTLSDMAAALDLHTSNTPSLVSCHDYDSVYSLHSQNEQESQIEIRSIKKQLDAFREKLLQKHSAMATDSPSFTEKTNNISSSSASSSDEENTDPSSPDYCVLRNENRQVQEQLHLLRRNYNELVLESAFLRKENNNYKERLQEESNSRKKLQNELRSLIKSVEEQPSQTFDSSNQAKLAENIQHLLAQLNACREDFFEERKEKEQYKLRNTRMEKELEEAKKLIEQQNRKLVLYANYFKNPIKSELRLPVSSNNTDRKRHSRREKRFSHGTNQSNRDIKNFDTTKRNDMYDTLKNGHKNDHIVEACLSNTTPKCRNIKRESNIFSNDCTDSLNRTENSASKHHENLSRRRLSLNSHIVGKNQAQYSPTRPLHSPLLSSVSSEFIFSDLEMDDIRRKNITGVTTSSPVSTNSLCYSNTYMNE